MLLVILNRSIRLNAVAHIIMGMLVSCYAYIHVRDRPIDRSRERYMVDLLGDNSLLLEFPQRCVAFFSRLNASIAVQTSGTRSS